jgi:phosphatidylethanolamine-binding protein (PEBP) family uncharacterized protein
MTWVHWILYNLPATTSKLPEAVGAEALPPGTEEGQNDWKNLGYGGPCPPIGRHRYFHKLYALGHCQSKFVYFAKTSKPDFAAIDFPTFFRVDLSGSMAAPSIWNFALTTPPERIGLKKRASNVRYAPKSGRNWLWR